LVNPFKKKPAPEPVAVVSSVLRPAKEMTRMADDAQYQYEERLYVKYVQEINSLIESRVRFIYVPGLAERHYDLFEINGYKVTRPTYPEPTALVCYSYRPPMGRIAW
jgi:hypothetical protein